MPEPRPATAAVPSAGFRFPAYLAPITSPEIPALMGAAVGVPDLDGTSVGRLPSPHVQRPARGNGGLPQLKVPREGSVESHFISFSGVIMWNSRSRIPE